MAAPAPGSQREIRTRNLSRVLYAVAERDSSSSRASVAASLGLTRAAVSTLVDELLRAGLLTERGPALPGGGPGRPGTVLEPSDRGPCGLGAEIGVDHLAVCAVDLGGRVRARTRVEYEGRGSEPAVVLDRLGALVDTVADEVRGAGLRPAGLTVAVPGLVSRGTSRVVRAPNLGWHDTDIATPLARHAAPPQPASGTAASPFAVTVDNEANLAALAEVWLDGGRMPGDFVHVSAEVGIGGAVVFDGEPLRGTRGFAGELGHVPVRPEGPVCACGGRGCLEQYAGEKAVLRAAGIGTEGPREGALTLLAARAEAGDRGALRALDGAGEALGVALAGAVNLLDPGAVVLGGVLARFARWLLPTLENELRSRVAAPGTLPKLLVSELGAEGPLMGAAHCAVRAVLDDPLAHAQPRA
ncbi:ROK family protein [Streptomyces iconiensis]|uniref:ROK family protein n=1 Tax=Streptomyces iconiensis TaxID=1384038 RepID=A0ABT6ZV47_9ACTN|nr:ROK family protein [Streptomyces iconiensis]MDJ1132947.1 ROK family protein [Streptomyces iconiensis]